LRSKTLIIATLVVVLAAGAAAGTYAYDQGRSDEIGKGVSVGGISLDGLTAAQAHAKLDRLIVQPLERRSSSTTTGRRGRSARARRASRWTSTRSSTTRWPAAARATS
jgi:hypothetical protein